MRSPAARVVDEARVEEHVEPFLESLQDALLLIKHEGFADEREIRYSVMLVTRPGPAGSLAEALLLSYRASAYGIAPYLRLTGPDVPVVRSRIPFRR